MRTLRISLWHAHQQHIEKKNDDDHHQHRHRCTQSIKYATCTSHQDVCSPSQTPVSSLAALSPFALKIHRQAIDTMSHILRNAMLLHETSLSKHMAQVPSTIGTPDLVPRGPIIMGALADFAWQTFVESGPPTWRVELRLRAVERGVAAGALEDAGAAWLGPEFAGVGTASWGLGAFIAENVEALWTRVSIC